MAAILLIAGRSLTGNRDTSTKVTGDKVKLVRDRSQHSVSPHVTHLSPLGDILLPHVLRQTQVA